MDLASQVGQSCAEIFSLAWRYSLLRGDIVGRREGYANNTNRDSTASPSVSTAGPSINTASENINTSSPNINTASPIPNDSSMQSLENTGIFDDAYDDREVGAEADLNNLETTMNVSPITTTRIHKDHPIDQIIGDINSATQTRRMTKISKEHAMVSYIKKQKRTNHKDYQNCLFACFLSQQEPKKVIQALTDPSWIEAMQEELLQFKLQRNKARLVAQGYTQEEGINYDEVFAPVARIEAIRLFLAYALFMGFIVYQIDVKSALLYGTIKEEVYVCQPPGFEDPHFPDKVYKIEKSLYGLHKAPKAWYETLSTYLLENRFRRCIIDKTLFIKKDKKIPDEFYGGAHLLLSTSMEPNKALVKDEEAEAIDVHLYRSMIGSLMYLTASRPDIMFAICVCASDYARASLDRKSTTGGCQFIGRRLISWQCKKKTIVSNSTTQAVYVAAANCCGQVLWIQNQMLDYEFNFMNTKIYIDNESTICIVKNPVQEDNGLFGSQDLCLRQELLEYIDVHDSDAFESSQPSWEKMGKLIQFMHTTMVPIQVKTMKIQAEVQVSRPGELRRHLQLWKTLFMLYLYKIGTLKASEVAEAVFCYRRDSCKYMLEINTRKCLCSLSLNKVAKTTVPPVCHINTSRVIIECPKNLLEQGIRSCTSRSQTGASQSRKSTE
ncbi:retrovirus-related pol polyprotein from transposon TNT 1-94 [Tanacetum coccineum]